MKVTKYIHSCLLVEEPASRILIDAGQFSFESKLLDPAKIGVLDYIVYTHEHADHYYEPLLLELSKTSPHATIVTNQDLAAVITALKLSNPVSSTGNETVAPFSAIHEPLPLGMPNVLNVGVHIGGQLTHCGDSYELSDTKDFLALPITAPFASLREALDAVVKLKPKAVLPLHDWEWHDAARTGRYHWAKGLLAPHDIDFIELENGVTVEL